MYGSDVSPAQSAAHQQARISRAHERRVGSRRPVPPAEEGAQAPHRTPAVQTPESLTGERFPRRVRLAVRGAAHRIDDERDAQHVNLRHWPRRTVMALIRVYQVTLAHLVFTQCRFVPSCSRYTYEAVERYGAVRGVWLGIRRILRCHPLHPGGYDPVP